MQSHNDRWQEGLFVAGPLRDLVPEGHILKRVDAILSLSCLHDAGVLLSGQWSPEHRAGVGVALDVGRIFPGHRAGP